MLDLDPETQKMALKGVFKIFGGILSQLGPGVFRKNPNKAAEERLLEARTTVNEQKILAEGELAVAEIKAQGGHNLRKLQRELTAKERAWQAEDIDVLLDDVWVVVPEPVQFTFGEGKPHTLEYAEQKHLRNMKQVTREALKALPEHARVSDEPVDPDWVARHVEASKDVSSEEMQKLWGRLLAGEVAQPGAFSLRTLDILRNMTRADALLFERYCGLADNDGAILAPSPKAQKRIWLKHPELLRLNECGLLHNETLITIGPSTGNSLPVHSMHGDKTVVISESPEANDFFCGAYLLTSAGRELRKVTRALQPNDEFLEAICATAREQNLMATIVNRAPLNLRDDSQADKSG